MGNKNNNVYLFPSVLIDLTSLEQSCGDTNQLNLDNDDISTQLVINGFEFVLVQTISLGEIKVK